VRLAQAHGLLGGSGGGGGGGQQRQGGDGLHAQVVSAVEDRVNEYVCGRSGGE
jgi:hypothetical protein